MKGVVQPHGLASGYDSCLSGMTAGTHNRAGILPGTQHIGVAGNTVGMVKIHQGLFTILFQPLKLDAEPNPVFPFQVAGRTVPYPFFSGHWYVCHGKM